ncbi:MAG TPA: hypothetical protein VLJ79_24380, partial [Candidatus Binatia bacterium]|nr:hypothetical protein [Candidatus Binatia bacterium]
ALSDRALVNLRDCVNTYANSDSAGMANCFRKDRIISTVSFLFLLRTSDTRLPPESLGEIPMV